MAAPVVVARPPGVTEDDEEWLYGGDQENKEPVAPGTGPEAVLPVQSSEKEDGEMSTSQSQSQDKGDDENDDDDDSDDDDVQVTIGDIKAFSVTSGGALFKPGGTYQKQPVIASGQKSGANAPGAKGVDVEAEGQVNGISLYEFSLDSLREEDKPWRKPGADITDYFNYGFNEDTWRKYCQKQNRLRFENGVPIPKAFQAYASLHNSAPSQIVKMEDQGPKSTYKPSVMSTPQPIGTIAVLGSTAASRRPIEEQLNDVHQIGTLGSDMSKPPPGMPPMGMHAPDFSVPPPGMPPPGMPLPPGFSPAVPPPGMSLPPPNMFSQPPPPFFSNIAPPSSMPYTFDTTQPQPTYSDSRYESRDRDHDPYRERDTRDRDSRDYYRDSRQTRERSRERSRSRDRDRRHRDRDRDDKKSKRKIKDEPDDSDYYKSSSSSKHKKSKRSKREKDGDSTDKPGES
ncbi:pre-mRNA 3'-end-processing factor FIP1-like isoform X2 [Dreissena polymorpha]|uniref:pre-mRNA 3'-end-processing factor FIP1-like isoform X2 n=1 Tax=Dreissena polymorpha TaxID=45954 RepID=UPI0022655C3D|nr:pre-mRNA 3'-end-processing factor FIP1-like isoform X2 [Dreissena polymorpha]